ncbi:MAG: Peptidase M29, aminopeptidase II [Candidatus Peregrinibacteria bacterium GW2011_GWA2_33_10]|nr:MAG: Peptidase M29, aminopeptidase II [Candidatus Peregrinibacteria bacterium GW2011_GWA2_33_10]KKP40897.1 MAG: peptidase M29 aminopeptidase II, aminopeptidase [Candidatus Peregrinibacteria bacterium GW2011_GWC2_33_13]
MSKSRHQELADILVNYSCKVKAGETVEITGTSESMPLFREVVKLCYQKGAFVRPNLFDEELAYLKFKYASDKVLKTTSKFRLFEAKNTDVFINLGGEMNTNVLSNIDPKKIQESAKANLEARNEAVKKRWVICEYPSRGLAQEAKMSLEEYENFVFSACLQDWEKITGECKKIGNLMHKAKKFHIKSKDTDLMVDISGCPASSQNEKVQGSHNMPDGEIFTSPNRYKTEGHIYFPWPSKKGKEVRDVYLEFKKGKVVKATASMNEDYLHEVLKTDKLSNSLGEVAIGLNYGIKQPTNNILFDEKIGGSIHIALGAGYKDVNGDPNSSVHWDLVKDMKNGEVWFDDKLVMKKGKIVI